MGTVESQVAPFAKQTSPPPKEPEVLSATRPVTLTIRRRDGSEESRTFTMRTFGPQDRKNVALLVARLTDNAPWSALPADYRAWVNDIARVGVMFVGQPDFEWLSVRCERSPVVLDKISEEVEAFWAETFPENFVVGEGPDGKVIVAVEVASPRASPPAGDSARAGGRRAVVTPA